MKFRDVTIHRQFKHEAEKAISDLEKRGFEVVFPLTELKRDGKRFKSDAFNRKIFIENTFSSCWIAKLRKVKEGNDAAT
jgi:muramoyltetrapeptide carboxypeptidase LdcA involved in peptidoglycan recycling